MIELRDRRSELDKQSVQLIQGKYELSSQLDQNELERKRVRIDQKAVSRNIKELERERNIFENATSNARKLRECSPGTKHVWTRPNDSLTDYNEQETAA